MQAFTYSAANSIDGAAAAAAGNQETRYIAGGTTLVDLMKLEVERPRALVDINGLPLARIEPAEDGGLKIGAMVRNSDLANDATVKQKYAVLSQALLSGASPQLRNMATTGGNLLQRTRCYYFRDVAYPQCNKRKPGSGCAALEGYNRMHAVLGVSDHCIATSPGDMPVAMQALEAVIVTSAGRKIPVRDFYTEPGDHPERENTLRPGELITHVLLPPPPAGARSHYLKLRDRSNYEFALASAAVVTVTEGGRIRHARVALGGVATVPWRSLEAEHELENKPVARATFERAAHAAMAKARPYKDNGFKIELARRALVRTLEMTTAQQPGQGETGA
jgi:xanthine dehydrogenase YagS FAD-binding subunit